MGERTPGTMSEESSMAAMRVEDPQEGVTVQELPPVDKGIRAWTFCAAAFVLEMMVWGFGFSYGIFQDYYTSHPPFEKSSGVSIAAVGTIALALQYGEGFFLSFFLGRYSDYLHPAMWFGLVLYFASLFFSSFATEVWQLMLLQGVGVGIGGGILYMPVIRLLPEWFSERRGLAGGIIFSGTGVGGFAFPFLLNTLLDKVGLRWTLRIWAIGTSFFSGIALLGMRSRFPTPKYGATQRRPKFIPPQLTFLKTGLFWSFAVTNLLQGLSYFPVSLYIPTFTRSLSDQLTATVVLALFNSSAVLGQVILGHLSDRFPYPSIMVVSALGSALGAFLLWGFANAAAYLYVFAIIFGGLSGGFSSTWPNAAAECAGNKPEYAGMAFSGLAFSKGISAVIGPIIAGLLLEAGKGASMSHGFGRFGYGAVEIFVGSCAVATGLGSVAVALARQRILS
ncbi:MFS general substrate transporter [Lentinus tigrinus ALCF2SS1-7]|uniref:MFS general substrate transporter n=1 Tax=Lentinus tigrinus ALCF2SS1-6 TaxID=1328759 RepID=A0A5C2RYF5_9APHY|nr:MFS general substrate transporter [Lentinus tigrinus ALCF2SS1-6]RPD74026.1 MFS general substrate transporter [Lentinus tigrinus ALCF2SS1-7]